MSYFDRFNSHRDSEYSIFKKRVITTTHFSKEFTQGLIIPFFISDFFQFGLTSDLVDLWDIPLFDDYLYNSKIKNKLQHENMPYKQHHVEQKLWLAYISKHHNVTLKDKFGDKKSIYQSYKYMINNLIILGEEELNLVVPQRLRHKDNFFSEHFTYRRWHYLYCKNFNLDTHENVLTITKWKLKNIYFFIRSGARSYIKMRLRLNKSSRQL